MMKEIVCPFCERRYKKIDLGREKGGGVRISCEYCKKEWIEHLHIKKIGKKK